MYGTIAKLTVKPGKRIDLIEFLTTQIELPDAYRGRVLYQMDSDSDVFYLAGWFESKTAYFAHSDKPETHQTYLRLLELLVGEPEWHDGYIVLSDVRYAVE